MTFEPFIPLPIMAVICILLLVMKRKGVWNFIRQIIIVLLIFGMNMRLLLPTNNAKVIDKEIDVLFVVDNTISMLAEDYTSKDLRRIDGAKEDIKSIVDAFPDARFAMITFNNRAELVVPYTHETDLILRTVDGLEGVLPINADGTSLNMSIDTTFNTLERNCDFISDDEDEQIANKNKPKRIQLVFFISDGEITNHEGLESFEDIGYFVDSGAVLGYGTEKGAQMTVLDIYSGYVPLQYYDENLNKVTAISSIDEDNLEDIAEDINVEYYHMESSKDINKVIKNIKGQIEEGEFTTRDEKIMGYKETYQWFALALVLFISTDFLITRIKMRSER